MISYQGEAELDEGSMNATDDKFNSLSFYCYTCEIKIKF